MYEVINDNDGSVIAKFNSRQQAQNYVNKHSYRHALFVSKTSRFKATYSRKRVKSKGSKNRVNTKRKRKLLYAWAWNLEGKGSLSRIGKKMKSLKRSGGVGSKKAIVQLGRISSEKQAFIKGYKACKRGR